MSNNTYQNAILGSKISIIGSTLTSVSNSINSANVYGVTSNVSSFKLNIVASALGPFYLLETDTVNTPLANIGIPSGKYNTGIISGTVANATVGTNSFFNIGTNWNAILNSLPKNQRGSFKLTQIAQSERQKNGTNSFRNENIFIGTHSPTQSHPWGNVAQLQAAYGSPTNVAISSTIALSFTIAHGLGHIPHAAYIQMTTNIGDMWITSMDATNVHVMGTALALTGTLVLY